MDQRLAEIYGTNQESEADVEKLAAAELAEQLEDDDSIDLDGLDEEQLESLAAEVLEGTEDAEVEEPGEEDEEQEASGDEEDDGETMKLAEADFEQADTMGRIMAHAFVQENREIEKSAAFPQKHQVKGLLHRAAGKAKEVLTGSKARAGFRAMKDEKKKSEVAHRLHKNLKSMQKTTRGPAAKGAEKPFGNAIEKRLAEKAGRYRVARGAALRGAAETGAAYGAAGGAAAYGVHKARGKKKQASALETLATQRAEEILAASQAEQTTPYDVLADVVEQRATEILAENGYEVSEESEE